MERLTDDMLTLAKAERGGLVQPRRVPIDDFVEDLRRDLPLLDRAATTWSRPFTASSRPTRTASPRSCADLVTNAARHTGSDGHIDVSIGSQNGAAIFAVADDGTGIEPEPAGPHLRSLPPDRREPQPRRRRQWPGPGDRAGDRRGARRHDQRQLDAWTGRDDPFSDPGLQARLGRDLLAGLGVDQGDRLRGAGTRRVDHLPQRRAPDEASGVVHLEGLGGELGAIAVGQAGLSVYVDF